MADRMSDDEFMKVWLVMTRSRGMDPLYSEFANTTPRVRPTDSDASAALAHVIDAWPMIAGSTLAAQCMPVALTGRKLRRLVVAADYSSTPPWGAWDRLGRLPGRATFTALRQAVNAALAPHGVDHIDFVPRTPEPEPTPAEG